jgi:hypothetical protein
VKQSIVTIAETIGNEIGFDQVILEPNLPEGQVDIEFKDDNLYYLEVKSPNLFKSKYNKEFNQVNNQIIKLLAKNDSQLVTLRAVGSKLIPLKVRQIDRQDKGASMSIIAYDTSFPPRHAIVDIIRNSLHIANEQLSSISSKSKKIFVLDITSYILKNEKDFSEILLQEYEKNSKNLQSLDGIILFSSYPGTSRYSFIPVFLGNGIDTEVFKRNSKIHQSSPIMIAINKRSPNANGKILEIEKGGNIKIDDISYGNLGDCLRFDESDSKGDIKSNHKSEGLMLTHAQRFK